MLYHPTDDYGTVVIEMIPFVCRLAPASAAPLAHEHVALRWVAKRELLSLDLAPADVPVVAALDVRVRASAGA